MLSTWYFCCCAEMEPDAVGVYLSIHQVLESPDTSPELLEAAWTELCRSEPLAQIYAFPAVLGSLRKFELSARQRAQAAPYFNELLELLPEVVQLAFGRVFDAIQRAHEGITLESAISILTELPARSGPERSASEPYLDLRTYLPEVLLLAILVDGAERDSGFASKLETALDRNQQLLAVFDSAVDHDLGRMAFLLATKLAMHIATAETIDEHAARLWDLASEAPLYEPDLLESVLMRSCWQVAGDGIDRLSELLFSFDGPRRLGVRRSRPGALTDMARRVGLDADADLIQVVPFVYWQILVWETLASIEQGECVLGSLWQPVWDRAPQRVHMTGPSSAVKGNEWILSLLLKLHNLRNVGAVIERGDQISMSDADRRMLHSAWIRIFDGQSKCPPTLPLLRLFAALPIATAVLLRGGLTPLVRDELLALLVHGNQWIGKFRAWIKSPTPRENDRRWRLPGPMIGLALFADWSTRRIALGLKGDVAPNEFMQLARSWTRFDHAVGKPPPQLASFRQHELPAAMLDWIENAVPITGEVDHGPGRWLTLVRSVADAWIASLGHGQKLGRDRIRKLTLIRFFHPTAMQHELPDWRFSTPGIAAREWPPFYLSLLLTPGLGVEEWVRADWPEPTSDSTYLARAIERVSAALHGDQDPRYTRLWRQELATALSRIQQTRQLDRLLRLRLLHLVRNPEFTGEGRLRMLIVQVLVEFGGKYELSCLVEYIIGELEQPTPPDAELLVALTVALDGAARVIDSPLSGGSDHAPRDPHAIVNWRGTAQFVSGLVARLLFAIRARHDRAAEIFARIRTHHHEIRLRNFDLFSVGGDIIRRDDGGPMLELQIETPHDVVLRPTSVLSCKRDDSAMWFFEQYDTDTRSDPALDMRMSTATERKEFFTRHSADSVYVLGMVIGYDDKGSRVAIDCGLGSPQRVPSPRQPLASGMPLSLPMYRPVGAQKWMASSQEAIRPLVAHEVDPRMVEVIVITKMNEPDRSIVHLLVNGDRLAFSDWRHLVERWLPDPSQLFTGAASAQYRVVAKVSGKSPVPIDLTMIDLLLHMDIDAVQLVLAAVGGVANTNHYRFQVRPGVLVVLKRDDFEPSDADELWQRLDKGDALGLLIVVEARRVADGVRLALVRVPNARLVQRYRDLQAPFDERNLRWLALFKDPDDGGASTVDVATRESSGQWVIDVASRRPPGFPSKLSVTWASEPPKAKVQAVDVEITSWGHVEAVRASVEVKAIAGSYVSPDANDWAAFASRWLDPTAGMVIGETEGGPGLRRNSGGELRPDGSVWCRTKENISVLVEAESITMRPLASDVIRLTYPRALLLTRCERSPSKPLLLEDGLVPSLRYGEADARGLLVEFAHNRSGKLARVLWVGRDGRVDQQHIKIANREDHPRLDSGNLITGTLVGGHWKFHIQRQVIRGRALWRREQRDEVRSGHHHMGRLATPKGPWLGFEIEQGLFQVRPVALERDFDDPEPSDGCLLEDTAKEDPPSWWEDGVEVRRSFLLYEGKRYFGRTAATAPVGKVVLRQLRMLVETVGSNLHDIVRSFDLRERKRHPTRSGPAHANEKPPAPAKSPSGKAEQNARHRERWTRYLLNPENLQCRVENQSVVLLRLHVPSGKGWSNRVPLADGEKPFVALVDYAADEAMCRVSGKDVFRASFRQVPPLTVEQYRSALEAQFDEPGGRPLHPKLYFVDWKDDLRVEDPSAPLEVRFEFGFGHTLVANAEHVRLGRQPLDRTQLVLYHGDAVTRATFRDIDGTTVLDIEEHDLENSESRSLYTQAKHGLLHILHLRRVNEIIEIDHIEGLAERRIKEVMQPYHRVQAELEPMAQARLLQRESDDFDEDAQMLVLGRLNIDLFWDSVGRRVVYDHVGMSFEPGPYTPLRDGDIVMVRGGRLEPRSNDTLLRVHPIAGLHSSDIGEDTRRGDGMGILRRGFSASESVLPKFMDEYGPDKMVDRPLLVQVQRGPHNRSLQTVIISSNPPRLTRRLSVLISLLNSKKECLATVLQWDIEELILELRPSVFFRVPRVRIGNAPEDLKRGAVVRLSLEMLSGGRPLFHIAVAVPSDHRYVDTDGRAVVVLPKTRLLHHETPSVANDPSVWRSEPFTIGGFPNLAPRLGCWQDKRWGPPHYSDFITLMETRHPKLGYLGRDASGSLRLAPALNATCWGSLIWSERKLVVKFRGRLSPDGELIERDIQWSTITFEDDSIVRVCARMRECEWFYHDGSTGHWVDYAVEKGDLRAHTLGTGPLFFHRLERRAPCLRYPPLRLLTYGYPMNELVTTLSARRGQRGSVTLNVPVAGVTATELWVELAPGRICEVPIHALSWRGFGPTQAQTRIDLRTFSIGDKVRVQQAQQDPFAPPVIEILDWRGGARGAFGRNSVFLPVAEFDDKNGALRLGVGEWSVTLPVASRPESDYVELLSNNEFCAINSDPRPGDVVLLVPTDKGVSVLGMPDLRPWPEPGKHAWEHDPLVGLLREGPHGPRLDLDVFGQIAESCGGALPVLVERVDQTRGELWFSRRQQLLPQDFMTEGVGLARVQGLLPRLEKALIRIGGALYLLPLEELVCGLPRRFYDLVVAALVERGTLFPVRRTKTGTLAPGTDDAHGQVSDFRAEVYIPDVSNAGVARGGIICRSLTTHRLYWMSDGRVAWSRLPPTAIEDILIRGRRTLRACHIKDGALSVVDVGEARTELRRTRVGTSLFVRVLWGDDNGGYVVFSVRSGVMLWANDRLGAGLDIGRKAVRMIASERSFGPDRRLVVVPPAARRWVLDLPDWMFGPLPAPGQLRPAFARQLRFFHGRSEDGPLGHLELPMPEDLIADEFDALVCWHLGYDCDRSSHDAIHLSRDWIRRRRSDPQLPLLPALLSVMTLAEAASQNAERIANSFNMHTDDAKQRKRSWESAIRTFLTEIGSRALRSLHLEVLARDWLGRPDERKETAGLRRRFEDLMQAISAGRDDEMTIAGVEAFRRAVELYDDDTMRVLADALAAANGTLLDPRRLVERAEILSELASLHRIVNCPIVGSTPEERRLVRRVIETVIAQGLDIVLLEPAPMLNWVTSDTASNSDP